jgi:hypothetical protein
MSPEELLDRVRDRESFVAFVEALADERERAEALERANPGNYALALGGALNWQNGEISSFLNAALRCFDHPDNRDSEEPTWRLFAEFLYFGKIYE